MNSNLLLKYFSIAAAAALKFIAGPITGLALGLTWYETALCSVVGMMTTVIVTTYVGNKIQAVLSRWRKNPSRKFTKTSRFAVRIWKRFGIIGIAVFTPLLLSPVGGAVVAVAFRVPRQAIFFWMLMSGLSVGGLITYLVYRLQFVQEWLTK